MPQLKPLQLSKYQASGLLSSDALGTARIGAGTISAPRVAEPIQMAVKPKNSQYGADLGERAANFVDELHARALRRAAEQQKVEGMQTAMQLYQKYDGLYNGTEQQPIGIAGLSKQDYITESKGLLKAYRDEIQQVSQSLPAGAAAQFINDADQNWRSLSKDVAGRTNTEWESYKTETAAASDSMYSHLLSREYISAWQARVTDTEDENNARFSTVFANIQAESIRRMQLAGVNPQDPVFAAAYHDKVVQEMLENVYLRDDGVVVGAELLEHARNTIQSAEIKEAIMALPGKAIDRRTANLKKQTELEKAANEAQSREQFSRIHTALRGFTSESEAAPFIQSLYAANPDNMSFWKPYVESMYNDQEMTPEAQHFLVTQLGTDRDIPEIIALAASQGYSFNSQGLNMLFQSRISLPKQIMDRYDAPIETLVETLMTAPVGAENYSDRVMSKLFGLEDTKQLISKFKVEWRQRAQSALGDVSDTRSTSVKLEAAFNTFKAEMLSPDVIDTSKFTYKQSSSSIPESRGIFKHLGTPTTYAGMSIAIQQLAEGHSRTPGRNLDPLVKDFMNEENYAFGKTRAQVLTGLAEAIEKTPMGDPRRKQYIESFWNNYRLTQYQIIEAQSSRDGSIPPLHFQDDIDMQMLMLQSEVGKSIMMVQQQTAGAK